MGLGDKCKGQFREPCRGYFWKKVPDAPENFNAKDCQTKPQRLRDKCTCRRQLEEKTWKQIP